MWIDSTYFTGEYLIQNVLGTNPIVTINDALLTKFITKYEPEYLKLLLGETLYDELIAGLAVTPTPAAKWIALKAKLIDTVNKNSPIEAYIWNRYWLSEETKTTTMGQVVSKVENGYIVSSNQRLVSSWNDAMMQGVEFLRWLTLSDQVDTYSNQNPDYDHIYLTNNFGI